MSRRILIIQGHPDPDAGHLDRALAEAYRAGAESAGHEVRVIDVTRLDFPVLRSREDWESGTPVDDVKAVQEDIDWADHLVVVYPLWLGTMPALLKAFLEQVLRPGFALGKEEGGRQWRKGLTGKSARIVVTMGMPAFVYRWFFGAHSLKSLERNILKFCGIKPVRESLFGLVEAGDDRRRKKWLKRMEGLGRRGA